MKNCKFCSILNEKNNQFIIYEDDFVLAFLSDDFYGHTIVISKKHYESVETCDNSTLARLIELCKKIGNHYVNDCGFDGFDILSFNGKFAEQKVPHVSFEIIPRKQGDNLVLYPTFPENHLNLHDDNLKIQIEEIKPTFDDKDYVIVYTDGACSGNPGVGGWASILSFNGKEKVISGGEKLTTNNRMELLAVIHGLKNIKNHSKVKVFSDSAYVVNAFNQNWISSWQKNNWKTSGNSEVLNKDLWQTLLELTNSLHVEFIKVKGHSDNVYNNRCDALAREEISKISKN